jgi:protein SCO1/2
VIAVTAAAAGVLAQHFIHGSPAPVATQRATVLSPPRTITGFSLVDQSGQPFTPERLRGKWTFVFFGYTHCPDVCPTTLSALARVDELLRAQPGEHENVQTVFVSVDPQRDTPQTLAQYVAYFNRGFTGVTGTQEQIDRLARDLGIVHLRTQEDASGGYLIDHTASVLLINPDGKLRALFGVPHDPKLIAADFEKIRKSG